MISKVFFKNITPSSQIYQFARRALRELLDFAPYGSTGYLVVEKQETDFRCSLNVCRDQGPLSTSSIGPTLQDAIVAATKKIRKQLCLKNKCGPRVEYDALGLAS